MTSACLWAFILTLHDRDISQKEKSDSLRSGFGTVRPFYLFCAIIRMFFLTLSRCKHTTVNLCYIRLQFV